MNCRKSAIASRFISIIRPSISFPSKQYFNILADAMINQQNGNLFILKKSEKIVSKSVEKNLHMHSRLLCIRELLVRQTCSTMQLYIVSSVNLHSRYPPISQINLRWNSFLKLSVSSRCKPRLVRQAYSTV